MIDPNTFGAPGTGVHAYRFAGVAIVDYLMTLGAAVLLSLVSGMPLDLSTILLLVLGVVGHGIVGVRTASNVWLWPRT